jgi:hypothetical protein
MAGCVRLSRSPAAAQVRGDRVGIFVTAAIADFHYRL